MDYKKLTNDQLMKEVWIKALGKDLGSLAQGDYLLNTTGTNMLFVLSHKQIPSDRTITYA